MLKEILFFIIVSILKLTFFKRIFAYFNQFMNCAMSGFQIRNRVQHALAVDQVREKKVVSHGNTEGNLFLTYDGFGENGECCRDIHTKLAAQRVKLSFQLIVNAYAHGCLCHKIHSFWISS